MEIEEGTKATKKKKRNIGGKIMVSSDNIADIMGFNRFYSNILNLMNQGQMNEEYSLTEMRVLLEISKTERCTANILVNQLNIDRSYMSRMIARFEKRGLIVKSQSQKDNRINYVRLTEKGRLEFNKLSDGQSEQILNIFNKMEEDDQKLVLDAMVLIRTKLSAVTDVVNIRPFISSDIEYIISRHKTLYYAERHLSKVFSDFIDEVIYRIASNFNPKTDCLNILECNGNPAGNIAIVKIDNKTAQLRFLMVEPELRGRGYGTKLIAMALDFCREKGYSHVFLTTISAQTIAQHLFEKHGFYKTKSYDKSEWGKGIVEERWDLDLK